MCSSVNGVTSLSVETATKCVAINGLPLKTNTFIYDVRECFPFRATLC
jgi:hypothetical protein